LPIAEHGVIGDQRSVALVGTDGTIDWYCPERFDAPSCSQRDDNLERERSSTRIRTTGPITVRQPAFWLEAIKPAELTSSRPRAGAVPVAASARSRLGA
jgi:hypothetical protein